MPVDDGRCFACGAENPIGLRLRFAQTRKGSVEAPVFLNADFQGWKGVAHGGITMALLDEAMAHAALSAGFSAVTASMATRFRNAVPLAQALTLTGSVAWIRRHLVSLRAQLHDGNQLLLAEAQGSFVVKGVETWGG